YMVLFILTCAHFLLHIWLLNFISKLNIRI
ncbi:hypothetical protein, partial [Plasmodium yoelii yoelii]